MTPTEVPDSLVLGPEDIDAFTPAPAAGSEWGQYEDLTDSLDIPAELFEDGPVAGKPADKPAESPAQPPAADATPDEGEEGDIAVSAPDEAPIADWQQRAEAAGLKASSEEEFRQAAYVAGYVRQQFFADATNATLYGLAMGDETEGATEATRLSHARERIAHYLTSKLEPWEDPDSVGGKLADFFDEETGALTERGKRMDTYVKDTYKKQVSAAAARLTDEAQSAFTEQQTYRAAAREALRRYKGAGPAALESAYRAAVTAEFESEGAWKGEDGKVLSPEAAAAAAIERRLWGNPEARKAMILKIEQEAKEKGESAFARKLLGL